VVPLVSASARFCCLEKPLFYWRQRGRACCCVYYHTGALSFSLLDHRCCPPFPRSALSRSNICRCCHHRHHQRSYQIISARCSRSSGAQCRRTPSAAHHRDNTAHLAIKYPSVRYEKHSESSFKTTPPAHANSTDSQRHKGGADITGGS